MQRGRNTDLEIIDRSAQADVLAPAPVRRDHRTIATVTRGTDDRRAPADFSFSSVEERWDVELRADGSARASVVVRREQQIGDARQWRFVARRELPGAAAHRSRVGVIAAGVAVIAASAALWAAWTRPAAPTTNVVVVPMPATPPPSPNGAAIAPVAAAPPVPVRAPVPLVFPPPGQAADKTDDAPRAMSSQPLDARPAVRDAMARAFASGDAEAWSDGTLSGFVVVGPAEAADGPSCRNTVILARGGEDGDRTISRRRCQAKDGSISLGEGA